MERRAGFGLLAVLLLLAVLNSAPAEGEAVTRYFMVGGTLDLRPSYSGQITNILWKHNGNLLAEWVQGVVNITYYGSFWGRAALETTSARLEIRNMSVADAGLYAVEINSEAQSPGYDARAIHEVPQPRVWIQPLTCAALDRCTLTCDGNTAGAEPVSYSWKEGDGDWKQSRKDVNITRTGAARVETFSCRMKNPVSERASEAKPNPFYRKEEPDGTGAVVGAVVAVLVVLGILGAVGYWKRVPILNWFRQRRGDSGAVSAAGNGQTDADNKGPSSPTDEAAPLRGGAAPGTA